MDSFEAYAAEARKFADLSEAFFDANKEELTSKDALTSRWSNPITNVILRVLPTFPDIIRMRSQEIDAAATAEQGTPFESIEPGVTLEPGEEPAPPGPLPVNMMQTEPVAATAAKKPAKKPAAAK